MEYPYTNDDEESVGSPAHKRRRLLNSQEQITLPWSRMQDSFDTFQTDDIPLEIPTSQSETNIFWNTDALESALFNNVPSLDPNPTTVNFRDGQFTEFPVQNFKEEATQISFTDPTPAVPNVANSDELEKKLIEIKDFIAHLESNVALWNFNQKKILTHYQALRQAYQRVNTEYTLTLASITKYLSDLKRFTSNFLCSISNLKQIHVTKKQLKLKLKQVDLLHKELNVFSRKDPSQFYLTKDDCIELVTFIWDEQPFPCTVKKDQKFTEDIVIQILTSSMVDIESQSIKISLLNSLKPTFKVEGLKECAKLESRNRLKISNLIFKDSTGAKSLQLKFQMELQLNKFPCTHKFVMPTWSKPFVIISHVSQKSLAEGRLLVETQFDKNKSLAWQRIMNKVSLAYLKFTCQNLDGNIVRSLAFREIDFLWKQKMGGKEVLEVKDFEEFWKWFAEISYNIRKKNIKNLNIWLDGIIAGFWSREEAEKVLMENKSGQSCFLIRFSKEFPERWVISYRKRDVLKHYLMEKEEMNSKLGIPEFLMHVCQDLKEILIVENDESGNQSWKWVHKSIALKKFCSSTDKRDMPNAIPYGYSGTREEMHVGV